MLQRRVGIIGLTVVVAATLALVIRPPIEEPSLSHELIAMQREIDETYVQFGGPGERFSLSEIPEDIRDRFEEQRDIDLENMDRLRPLLERFGWPTEKMVGREAVRAAFNVVGRAPDLGFKEFAVELMERAGEDDNPDYARLVDMIAVGKGEPQTYGTQWTCQDGRAQLATPVTDRATLNERRRQAGLGLYDKFASEFCFRGIEEVPDEPVGARPAGR